jgi:hypothetical protein
MPASLLPTLDEAGVTGFDMDSWADISKSNNPILGFRAIAAVTQ